MERPVHPCPCAACRAGTGSDADHHRRLNLALSRRDEQQRRWVAAPEAQRLGYGGFHVVAAITGLHPGTIRRGRAELAADLRDRPAHRVRLPGGGRPSAPKTVLNSSPTGSGWSSRRRPGARPPASGGSGPASAGGPRRWPTGPARPPSGGCGGPAGTVRGGTARGSPGRPTPTGTPRSGTSPGGGGRSWRPTTPGSASTPRSGGGSATSRTQVSGGAAHPPT